MGGDIRRESRRLSFGRFRFPPIDQFAKRRKPCRVYLCPLIFRESDRPLNKNVVRVFLRASALVFHNVHSAILASQKPIAKVIYS